MKKIKNKVIISLFIIEIICMLLKPFSLKVFASNTSITFENNEYEKCDYKYNTKINNTEGVNNSKCVEINLQNYDSGYFSYKFTGLQQDVKYNITAYIKTKNVSKKQDARKRSGALIYIYGGIEAEVVEGLTGTNEYKQMKISAYPTDGSIELMCVLEDCKGTAYFDNIEISAAQDKNMYSDTGNILIKYDDELINDIGGQSNIKELCNKWQKTYNDYKELTGRIPPTSFQKNGKEVVIIDLLGKTSEGVGAFAQTYLGYIVVDKGLSITDFQKYKARKTKGLNDYTFTILHEMGHLFENKMVWDFEGEGVTDLEAAYVLAKENAGAAPSEYSADKLFVGENIIEAYKDLGKTNDFYLNAYKLTQIAQKIGWDKMKAVIQNIYSKYKETGENYGGIDKFWIFTDELKKVAGKEMSYYYNKQEWFSILNLLNGVKNDSKKVNLNKSTIKIKENETDTITASTSPTGEKVDWLSDNIDIATIDNGKIEAKSVGNTKIYAYIRGSNTGAEANITVEKKTEKLEVTYNGYEEVTKNNKKYLENISPNTTVEVMTKNINTNGNVIVYKDSKEVTDKSQKVSTGMKLKISLDNTNNEYIIVVKGDTNGDGKTDLNDILLINKHRLNKVKLEGEYLQASDANKDGTVDFKDILQINKFRLGKIKSF